MDDSTSEHRRARELHDVAVAAWLSDTAGDDVESERYVLASAAAIGKTVGGQAAMRRPLNWAKALLAYEAWALERGVTPRENSRLRSTVPQDERHLGEWARYQRRHETNLTPFQRARLDASPVFAWDLLEDAWWRQSDEVVKFVMERGRLPALRQADQAEFALARWLNRQLGSLRRGTLPSSRARRLEEVIAHR
ncbi:helicase associated domain-containing protein [Marisediminicola sp. LYQ134]|uniref:helicase associated domain-containing protein n=1 Tax=Marisediminicola sp. LYQ134 TaxID=3391061 RepID=UPI00398350F1